MLHYTESGLRGVWLQNGYRTIQTPYGEATAVENVEGLHRAIARTLATRPARLTGTEFRFLRKELDLTQVALADLFGNDAQTVALWERGRKRVPVWADSLVRKLVLEAQDGNMKLLDVMRRVAEKHDAGDTKLVFREGRRGWVAAKAA
jgi:putative transcriptional regulator